jgi:ATP-dependent DNA helicase DinG
MFAAELAALEGDGGDEVPSLTPAQLEALFEAIATHRWDGHRDSWPEALDERAWRPLTTDHRGCSGSRCPEFRQCPYFVARQRIADTEVVVANHDLVLADLALGGGAVLPDPENSLYVFDEAHHLVEKAQQHFALEWRVRGSVAWLDGLNPLLATLQQRLRRPAGLVAPVDAVLSSLQEPLALARAMEGPLLLLDMQPSGDGRRQHRFVDGIVPRELADVADALRESLRGLVAPLDEVQRFVASDEGVEAAGAEGNEQWLGLVGNAQRRLDHGLSVLADFASAATPAPESQAPCARWLAQEGAEPRGDLVLRSVPVAIDDVLEGALWSRCRGALLTSATLAALGRFDHLFARAGLPADTQGLRLPSPFDYPRQGRLHIPAMRTDGGARDAHTDEIAEQIPELLEQERATLVLFTSWRQLRTVLGALPRRVERFVLCQGELGRSEILARHKAAIDGGKRSAIFGLNSFAEGIDLPGAYCTHVIICKLPFPVPDDPLFAGTCEWLARNGRDPFDELSVPEASLRMVQACGRLIRSEHDQGVITILDRRLVTRRYGRQILDALPPFARQIDRLPSA